MTAREVVMILEAHGWIYKSTTGSHHIYVKAGFQRPIPVPFHRNGNQDLGDFAKRILQEAKIKTGGKK